MRSEWLADPVRAPQWRKMLLEFDRTFGTRPDAAPVIQSGAEAETTGRPVDLDWDQIFPGEPREAPAWHGAYDAKIKGKFQWCPELTGYLVGDADDVTKFFLEASENYELTGTESNEPLLTYGAGTWLQDAKVESYLDENPEGKGLLCTFNSDCCSVMLEEGVAQINHKSCNNMSYYWKKPNCPVTGEWPRWLGAEAAGGYPEVRVHGHGGLGSGWPYLYSSSFSAAGCNI